MAYNRPATNGEIATGTARSLSVTPKTLKDNVWFFDGNTLSAEKKIGTLSNFDLPVVRNNVEKIRIDNITWTTESYTTNLKIGTTGQGVIRFPYNTSVQHGIISDSGYLRFVVVDGESSSATIIRKTINITPTGGLGINQTNTTGIFEVLDPVTSKSFKYGSSILEFAGGNQTIQFTNSNLTISAIAITNSNVTNSLILGNTNNVTNTTGEYRAVEINFGNFAPTSGSGVSNGLKIIGTINQTGGANGETRGIFISPSITASADWKAIRIEPNTGYGLYQTGASVTNYFNGNIVIGNLSTTIPLDVKKAVTATSNLAVGVNFQQNLTATANNDVLIGADVRPTFINGSFTGVDNIGLRVRAGKVRLDGYNTQNYNGTPTTFAAFDSSGVLIQRTGNELLSDLGVAGGTNAIIQNGNSFATAMFIGTNDTQIIRIKTNGSEALRINVGGNTGIGATTVNAKLHVNGAGSTSSTWTTQIHNSTGTSNTLMIRDDKRIAIGGASPLSLLHILLGNSNATHEPVIIENYTDSVTENKFLKILNNSSTELFNISATTLKTKLNALNDFEIFGINDIKINSNGTSLLISESGYILTPLRTSDPSTVEFGSTWYRTDANRHKYHDGNNRTIANVEYDLKGQYYAVTASTYTVQNDGRLIEFNALSNVINVTLGAGMEEGRDYMFACKNTNVNAVNFNADVGFTIFQHGEPAATTTFRAANNFYIIFIVRRFSSMIYVK